MQWPVSWPRLCELHPWAFRGDGVAGRYARKRMWKVAFRAYWIRRIFARPLKNSTSQIMPRNIITLGLFRLPVPPLHLRNDDAETKRCFWILLSLQPPFHCLDDVAARAEHLPPPQPKTSFAFKGFVSQREFLVLLCHNGISNNV